MTKTFQEFAVENLAEFGFSIAATDIPSWGVTVDVLNGITAWTDTVDDRTWAIIRGADISDGLWYEGFFTNWEGLYSLFKGIPSGTFIDTKKNIMSCLQRAYYQEQDQPAGLAGDGTGIESVVGEAQ